MKTVEINELESQIADQTKSVHTVDALNRLAFEIRNTNTQRSILLSKEAQQLSSLLNYPKGNGTALNNEAFCYVQITDYELALEKLMAALEIFETLKNERGIAQVHYNLCILYFRLGDYGNALDSINKTIIFYQRENNKAEMARCYFQMGLLYGYMNDHSSAIEYHTLCVKLNKELGIRAGEAASKMGLGQVYMNLKEFDTSRAFLSDSLKIRDEIDDKRGYAASLNAYMTLCLETENFDEAEQISYKGITLATELGDKMGISRFMIDLAKIYYNQKKIELAEEKAMEALELAAKINLKMAIVPAHLLLSEIYQLKGDFEKALHHFQLYFKVNAEISDINATMKAKSLQFIGKIENAQKEAEINRLKNVELKNAFEEIEEKNNEITASINYAKRIQTAILPPQKIVKQYLENSFILYQPKDIVAGDFYWMENVNDVILFAACDCTGHGVPGALVSVVCHNALNRAVREFGLIQPAAILDKTAEIVVENFSKSEEDIKDGMDISLCSYNAKTKVLQWAGANNPLWLFQNGEFLETKANKQPIGMNDNTTPFTNHHFTLNKGDAIYLFTDGFADQFGGETGQKKLTRKRFKELLHSIRDNGMEVQRETLETFLSEYRNGVEQIDDVLVMGIKI